MILEKLAITSNCSSMHSAISCVIIYGSFCLYSLFRSFSVKTYHIICIHRPLFEVLFPCQVVTFYKIVQNLLEQFFFNPFISLSLSPSLLFSISCRTELFKQPLARSNSTNASYTCQIFSLHFNFQKQRRFVTCVITGIILQTRNDRSKLFVFKKWRLKLELL